MHEPELEREPSAFAFADGATLLVGLVRDRFEIPAGRRNTAAAAELEYKATAWCFLNFAAFVSDREASCRDHHYEQNPSADPKIRSKTLDTDTLASVTYLHCSTLLVSLLHPIRPEP